MLLLTDEKIISGKQRSSEFIHQRSSIRYVRNDLKTYLTKHSLFNATPIKTKLIDISSGGLKLASSKKLRVNKKVCVNICFLDGYKFEISSKIVRIKEKHLFLYDLEFNTLNDYINNQHSTFSKVYMRVAGNRFKTKYRNITFNSVQILTYQEINKKEKITLVFEFRNGETVERRAKLKHFQKITKYHYGIKFDKTNQLLGNYLLKTQKSLVFAK